LRHYYRPTKFNTKNKFACQLCQTNNIFCVYFNERQKILCYLFSSSSYYSV